MEGRCLSHPEALEYWIFGLVDVQGLGLKLTVFDMAHLGIGPGPLPFGPKCPRIGQGQNSV